MNDRLDKAAAKRVNRAVAMAEGALTKPELGDVYLRRFHAAMDALRSPEEGEAVYHRCRAHGWYVMAAEALSHRPAALSVLDDREET